MLSIDLIETYAYEINLYLVYKKKGIKCNNIKKQSRSGKTNALLSLINHEPDIDKIYLHAKDPFKAKYQLLINKRESMGLKYLKIQSLLLNIQMI